MSRIGMVNAQGKKGGGGEGIVWDASYPIYVANAIPGDRIEYKVIKIDKRRAFGKLVRIISPSSDRVEPPCAIADQCGGCQLQHQSQFAQLGFKSIFFERLSRFIDGSLPALRPMVSSRIAVGNA